MGIITGGVAVARTRESETARIGRSFDLIEAGRDARGRRVVTVIPAVNLSDKLEQESAEFVKRRRSQKNS